MKKYKLIKEYPGSPELGSVVEKQIKSQTYYHIYNDRKFGVLSEHVEGQPEYWEEVNENIWWCVWERDYIQNGSTFFKAWIPKEIECIPDVWATERHYFKTKEVAEQYIIKNKPCLTLNDVGLILGGIDKKEDVFLELKRIVKSKL